MFIVRRYLSIHAILVIMCVHFQNTTLYAMDETQRIETALKEFKITKITQIYGHHYPGYDARNSQNEFIEVTRNHLGLCRASMSTNTRNLTGDPDKLYKLLALKYQEQQEQADRKDI
ncbi:MAG: hypothetical protein AB7F19_06600 [Candidatus Babeliales bacterium]